VTGRGHLDINRISGYLPGKIVYFLLQVCCGVLSDTGARRLGRAAAVASGAGGLLLAGRS
jgi:hypothetical protein